MSQGEGHRDAVVLGVLDRQLIFFIDGIRDDSQYYRSLYNLEQVEVLRGPNALLWSWGRRRVVNRVTGSTDVLNQFWCMAIGSVKLAGS